MVTLVGREVEGAGRGIRDPLKTRDGLEETLRHGEKEECALRWECGQGDRPLNGRNDRADDGQGLHAGRQGDTSQENNDKFDVLRHDFERLRLRDCRTVRILPMEKIRSRVNYIVRMCAWGS